MRLLSLLAVLLSHPAAAADTTPTFTTKDYGEEFATGYLPSKEEERFLRAAPRISYVGVKAAVPAKASLRGTAGPVENQGKCGSCWDFAMTTALRGTLARKGKDPGRLSFNYLLNCASNAWGCMGGNFAAAEYLVDPRGAPKYGSDGEYTGHRGVCEPRRAAASAVHYQVLGDGGNGPSFQDIAYAVGVLKKPVTIMVYVDDTWHHYAGGVYNACRATGSVNHLVVVEGYDCQSSVDKGGNCKFDGNGNLPAGVGTYTIRNSWGEKWGDHGYITTKATDAYGRRCNNVATTAMAFDVD